MLRKAKATSDPARFQGNGISYRAKIIGIEDIPEARGDKICQERLQKLKADVRQSGQHKQKVFINVTLEGLKIIDGVTTLTLHTHPVHQISFISRDMTDSRAFGYIYGPGDGTHRFFGIKTANAAENLVLTLRDLFQTVYEMKKQEIEDAKAKAVTGAESQEEESPNTTLQTTPAEGQAATETQESIYQVPKNNAPVNPQEQEEAAANLLDLEDQVDNILKGIEQIKNLEFDDLPSEAPRPPSAASAPATAVSASITELSDPWGAPAAAAGASVPSSALSDLQGLGGGLALGSNPFGMPAFGAGPGLGMGIGAPRIPSPGFSAMGMPFGMPGPQTAGLPVTRDPFIDNPFQPQLPRPQLVSSPNPFGPQAGLGNPFPSALPPPGMQMGFGMGLPVRGPQQFNLVGPMGMPMSPAGGVVGSLFQQQQLQPLVDDNLLQPIKPSSSQPELQQPPAPPPRDALFGDLLDIKKSTAVDASKSPKDLFKNEPPKKSLNEIKKPEVPALASPKASTVIFYEDPFSEDPFGSLDAVIKNMELSDPEPFHTTSQPFPSPLPDSSSPPLHPPSLPPLPPAPPDPVSSYITSLNNVSNILSNFASAPPSCTCTSSAMPSLTLSAPSSKESSPEAHFDMPADPPPPLPFHLMTNLVAPSPPPRRPPIPNRPPSKPSTPSPTKSCSFTVMPSRSSNFTSMTPPPMPTSTRHKAIVVGSASAGELCAAVRSSDPIQERDTIGWDDPRLADRCSPCASVFPTQNYGWSDSGDSSLSNASSHKCSGKTVIPMYSDDPFGVPLRSRKSFSSADVCSRSSRSSGRLSAKSGSKTSVVVDPFGMPLSLSRTSSSSDILTDRVGVQSENCCFFSLSCDENPVKSSPGKWEAFVEHQFNVGDNMKKDLPFSSISKSTNLSPFGDSPFLTPMNGKPDGFS